MASPECSSGDLLQQLAKCSHSLDSNQRLELKIFTEAGKDVLEEGARQLVRDAKGLPLLCSRSCDGTPLQVSFRQTVGIGSKQRRVSGKAPKELLVKMSSCGASSPVGGG